MEINKLLNSNNQRILIVDDTPENLDVLGKTLRPEGYNLAVANSGEQAIKTVAHFKPDLILMDVMMPGIDGYETCKKIKSINQMHDIPIIFVTAKHEPEDIIHGFDVGGVDYINKPFVQAEVCARVKSHLQLHMAKKQLVKLNDQKNKFLGVAAHDLRNPLTSIMGFSDLILDEIKNNTFTLNRCKNRISLIFKASTSMRSLINDLLDISMIEDGKLTLDKQKASICTLLTERVNIANTQFETKHIDVSFECTGDITAEMDTEKISRVVDNLLSNAIKFSPEKTSILIRVKEKDKHIHVSVIDEGPGIPDDEIETIFDEFKTLSPRPTAGEKSTGLGMYIVKNIVQAHQGEIVIKNNKHKGTNITFTLPASREIVN